MSEFDEIQEERDRELRSQVRNIEYGCSYRELLDTIQEDCPEYTQQPSPDLMTPNRDYYYTIDTLPKYWLFVDELDERLGYGRFKIEKINSVDASEYQRLLRDFPELANGASVYGLIGHITVKQILDGDGSILGVKTDNPDLLDFFAELLIRISVPRKGGRLPAERKSQREINLQTKPAGRKVDTWNPAAFDIFADGKENAELRAFQYWCKERGVQNPNVDDRKAFKKAMNRERDRRGTK